MKRINKKETWAEEKLRELFDKKKIKYQQHRYVEGMEVDFLLPGNVVVEVDGYVHLKPEVVRNDRRKEYRLQNHGYNLIRFTNLDVLYNARKCVEVVNDAL